MHISHLPNELLVNIIGRLDFDSVGSVLFLNKKFNNLVKVHRLYKPIADKLTVHVIKLLTTEDTLYDLFVKAILPSKFSTEKQTNTKIRQKNEKRKWYAYEDGQTKETLLLMLKKLQVCKTKRLVIVHQFSDFDIMDLILEAGIHMDMLARLKTASRINARFITKEHIDKLILLDETNNAGFPRGFKFANCTTSLRFEDLLFYIKQCLESMTEYCVWDLGVFTLSAVELNQIQELVDQIGQRIDVKYVKNQFITHDSFVLFHRTNSEIKGVVTWQNK